MKVTQIEKEKSTIKEQRKGHQRIFVTSHVNEFRSFSKQTNGKYETFQMHKTTRKKQTTKKRAREKMCVFGWFFIAKLCFVAR